MLLSFLSLTLQSEWGLTANQTANMTACVFAGSLFGTLTLGYLGDHYGRRPAFLLSCAIISVFGVLTAFSTGYSSLLGIRFMVGFGVGGLTVPFDIFAEFLPTSARGKHLLVIEYFWTAGSVMTPLFAFLTLSTSWRLFVILCAVPCIISGCLGVCLVPESPRWLISVGRDDEAMAVVRKAAADNGLNPDDLFHSSVKLKDEHVESSRFSDLLSKKWRKINILLWFTWIGYAMGYYGTILTVTRVFDADAVEGAADGGTPEFDYKAIFISASAEIVGLFVVIQTVDSIGRIPSQVMAYLGGGVFLFSLSMLADSANANVLTVLAFFGRAFEMMGSCVTWVSTAEILPTEIRTTGHSAANAMGRTGAFISPYLVGTNNPIKAVGVIMLMVHLVTAFCAYHLPESKGRVIGHIDDSNHTETDEHNEQEGSEMTFQYGSGSKTPVQPVV
jgi:MFS family permease